VNKPYESTSSIHPACKTIDRKSVMVRVGCLLTNNNYYLVGIRRAGHSFSLLPDGNKEQNTSNRNKR
jgi:hypothetical protein